MCALVSLKNRSAETNTNDSFPQPTNCCPSVSSAEKSSLEINHNDEEQQLESRRFDYYNQSCPIAEQIIRTAVGELYESDSQIAPAILRLFFHDCFPQTGGPFYPLYTGRRDSTKPSFEKDNELPNPNDDHSKEIHSFASRGFDERETVALLGAHSTGTIHCHFFNSRLNDFKRTGKPDPSIDTEFLKTEIKLQQQPWLIT